MNFLKKVAEYTKQGYTLEFTKVYPDTNLTFFVIRKNNHTAVRPVDFGRVENGFKDLHFILDELKEVVDERIEYAKLR